MKRILITGRRGYIGTAFRTYLASRADTYSARCVDLRDDNWRRQPFAGCDTLLHTAAIVHQTRAAGDLYDRVNTELTLAVAQKAKAEGVRQFIFMSTMAVYGQPDRLDQASEIGANTALAPVTSYGRSKLAAEQGLAGLEEEGFSVAILRPPLVYGANCPGNYRRLRSLALGLGLAPDIQNTRSMLYIGNLCELLRQLVDSGAGGVFCPRDREAVCTADLMQWIAAAHGRVCKRSAPAAVGVRLGAWLLPSLKKAFGNLSYAAGWGEPPDAAYCLWTTEEAVNLTECETVDIRRVEF